MYFSSVDALDAFLKEVIYEPELEDKQIKEEPFHPENDLKELARLLTEDLDEEQQQAKT